MTGCSAEADGDQAKPTTTVGVANQAERGTIEPPEPGEAQWVAIYKVEAPENGERDAFIEAAGAQVFEGPAACWEGVPDRLGVSPDAQVLGVAAATEGLLDDTITRLRGEPIVTGAFVGVCPAGH